MPPFRHHRRPFVKIYFIFFARKTRKQIKKCCLKASSFAFIPAFNFTVRSVRITCMFQKIKTKIKVIPYQGKRFLNKDILSACPHLTVFSMLFFSVLFGKGGFTSSTW